MLQSPLRYDPALILSDVFRQYKFYFNLADGFCVQTMKNVCRFLQHRLKTLKSAIINIEITVGRNRGPQQKGAYRYDKIAH